MFRIANQAFQSNPELQQLASQVLTEVIKTHLAFLFEEGWEQAPRDRWAEYVVASKLMELIPEPLMEELEDADIDPFFFFSHKIVQMMTELLDPEPITFDLLGEYLLAALIDYCLMLDLEAFSEKAEALIPTLKTKLFDHYQALEEDEKDLEEEWKVGYDAVADTHSTLHALTDFKNFLSVDEENDYVFWDADYTLIDDWGLGAVLKECGEGCLAVRGYGPEEVKRMVDGLI